MNENLKEFVKRTQKMILLDEKFKVEDNFPSSALKFMKNVSVHELMHVKVLVMTWNLAGSVGNFCFFVI